MKKPSFMSREFADDVAEKLRLQMSKLKPEAEQVYQIHHNIRRMTNQFDMPGPDMKKVIDFNVPGEDCDVPVRLYIPHQASEEPGPTFIYLHGGGFVTCSVESHEGITRRIASGTGYRVISVDYRLAPQFAYPAGPDDCERVLTWAIEGYGQDEYGIDRNQIALGGDSAGGNMTAYLAQKYRDKIKAQILFYPLMQLVDFKPPKPGPQDWLQLGFMALKFIDEYYVGDADPKDTRLSPLFETNLKDVPPAYVLTCGLDPLRDEGKLYADRLMAHGVPVVYAHEKLMPHGFLNFSRAFPKAKKIPLDAADFLREHMEKPAP
ncbi:alpha/beta hydrolase [Litorimonas sp. RW-G-Af-16]|uniref:alpha/beta hydrolase n=1 Tax=Litorimonas sp. RW-G-Af-16 TaxID=3241168 RepID=UPI00390CC715